MITSYRRDSSMLARADLHELRRHPGVAPVHLLDERGRERPLPPDQQPDAFGHDVLLVAAASIRDQSCPPMYSRIIRSQ